jgi:hypothetical protein
MSRIPGREWAAPTATHKSAFMKHQVLSKGLRLPDRGSAVSVPLDIWLVGVRMPKEKGRADGRGKETRGMSGARA